MTAEPQTFRAAGRLIDFMRQADEPGLINLRRWIAYMDDWAMNCTVISSSVVRQILS